MRLPCTPVVMPWKFPVDGWLFTSGVVIVFGSAFLGNVLFGGWHPTTWDPTAAANGLLLYVGFGLLVLSYVYGGTAKEREAAFGVGSS
jgi:hypothetical protein